MHPRTAWFKLIASKRSHTYSGAMVRRSSPQVQIWTTLSDTASLSVIKPVVCRAATLTSLLHSWCCSVLVREPLLSQVSCAVFFAPTDREQVGAPIQWRCFADHETADNAAPFRCVHAESACGIKSPSVSDANVARQFADFRELCLNSSDAVDKIGYECTERSISSARLPI